MQRRILVLTTSYPSDVDDPSGVFIEQLLVALARRGFETRVVAPSDGTFHGRRRIKGIDTLRFGYFLPRSLEKLTAKGGGIPVNMAASPLARAQVLPMMAMFLLRALWEVRDADVVYANWTGAGIVGAVVNLVTGKPMIISFRGDDGYLARDRVLWRRLTTWVCRRASVVAPVSAEILGIVRDLGVPEEKCCLPRFGVDTQMFYPGPGTTEVPDRVTVLYVGALIRSKGVQDLLAALACGELARFRLVVAGDGLYRSELTALAAKLGIEERIQWLGMLPPREVAELMRSADLLCLPSYSEGRPNVVNEAMATGLPVIATRIGGIPDMVDEGATALLFAPGDVATLRAHLRTLLDDSSLRKRMGNAGRSLVECSGLSWDSTAQEFHALISRILGDKDSD
ncbi:MAG: glycosyltransferase [Thermodesulfobacteriota bacterium]